MNSDNTPGMTFNQAVEQIRKSVPMARRGWKDKNKVLMRLRGNSSEEPDTYHITEWTAAGSFIVGNPNIPSDDIIASDWEKFSPVALGMTNGLDFAQALFALNMHLDITRASWGFQKKFINRDIYRSIGAKPMLQVYDVETQTEATRTEDRHWTATADDIFANDWIILPGYPFCDINRFSEWRAQYPYL